MLSTQRTEIDLEVINITGVLGEDGAFYVTVPEIVENFQRRGLLTKSFAVEQIGCLIGREIAKKKDEAGDELVSLETFVEFLDKAVEKNHPLALSISGILDTLFETTGTTLHSLFVDAFRFQFFCDYLSSEGYLSNWWMSRIPEEQKTAKVETNVFEDI